MPLLCIVVTLLCLGVWLPCDVAVGWQHYNGMQLQLAQTHTQYTEQAPDLGLGGGGAIPRAPNLEIKPNQIARICLSGRPDKLRESARPGVRAARIACRGGPA